MPLTPSHRSKSALLCRPLRQTNQFFDLEKYGRLLPATHLTVSRRPSRSRNFLPFSTLAKEALENAVGHKPNCTIFPTRERSHRSLFCRCGPDERLGSTRTFPPPPVPKALIICRSAGAALLWSMPARPQKIILVSAAPSLQNGLGHGTFPPPQQGDVPWLGSPWPECSPSAPMRQTEGLHGGRISGSS
jgi:hypothetical protein